MEVRFGNSRWDSEQLLTSRGELFKALIGRHRGGRRFIGLQRFPRVKVDLFGMPLTEPPDVTRTVARQLRAAQSESYCSPLG